MIPGVSSSHDIRGDDVGHGFRGNDVGLTYSRTALWCGK
jgi:hypothetical protein